MNFLTADVALEVDMRKLESQLAKARTITKKTATSMEKSFKKLEGVSKRIFSNIARYAKLAGIALLAAGVASIKMAMDVEESENLFEVSMGNMAAAARAWSEKLSDALYLNAYEVRKNVGVFNVMLDSMGMVEQAAYDMATGLTKLSYDMASFHNLRPEDMFRKLQSAIVGMPRPLQDLGYVVNELAIKQYALNQALWDGTGVMDLQTKILARYGLILKLTGKSQGDLERTLRSSTNVFRSIRAIIEHTAASIGKAFLPRVNQMGLAIRDWLKENKDNIEEWAVVWVAKMEEIVDWFKRWGTEIKLVAEALAALAIVSWVAPLLVTIKGLTLAFYGLGASLFTTAGATAAMTAHFMKAGFSMSAASNVASIWIRDVGVMRTSIWRLTTGLKAFGIAMVAAFTVYQIYRVIDAIKEYRQVLKGVIKHEEKLTKVLEDAATRRFEARMKGFGEMWPEVKPWPKDLRDPGKIVPTEAMKNYEKMMKALQFEYDMLGKINDVRERAEAKAQVWGILQEQENLTAEGRNQKLTAYMDLLTRLQEKQASFGHTVRLWINESVEWGKNLGGVLTDAFDNASDALADFVVKGKANFNALAQSILLDLNRMIIRAQMAQALGMLMPSLFGGGAAVAGGGGSTVAIAGSSAANPMAVFGAPPGLQHGGDVTKTGLAVVHKGETFSGVDKAEGGTPININVYAIDAAGTYQFLKKNKRNIATMVQGEIDGNHPIRRSKGWKS